MATAKTRRRIRKHNIDKTIPVGIVASIFASGSGSAMIGAFFGPIGAFVGGLAGATAAYLVEQKNENN